MIGATDPNWLLSTTAQSAAALVAIVGGFLVSRVITLTTERRAHERRLDELARDIKLGRERIDRASKDLIAWEAHLFLTDTLKEIVESRGTIELRDLMIRQSYTLRTEEELRFRFEERISEVRRAFTDVERVVPPDQVPDLTIDELRQRGVDVPPDDEYLYDLVLGQLDKERRPQNRVDSYGLLNIRPPTTPPEYVVAEGRVRREMRRDLRDAGTQVAALEAQEELTRAELGKVAHPQGLVSGLVALTYFALSGVILPLVVMATQPPALSLPLRIIIVAAFVSGFLWLVGYLVVSIKRVMATSPGQRP